MLFLITVTLAASVFAGQAVSAARNGYGAAPDYTDFFGKKIGVITGSICDKLSEDGLNAVPVYYAETAGAIRGVRNGEIDGYMVDLFAARVIAGYPGNEDLRYVEIPLEKFFAPIGVISSDREIVGRFNAFLAGLSSGGTLADMRNRWLETEPAPDSRIPDIPLTGENGTFRVATDGDGMPFSYAGVARGALKNYSIELVLRFAAQEGMDVEFIDVNSSGLIPITAAGKADLGLDATGITEERQESILFTDSIYDNQLAIVTLRGDGARAAGTGGGFIQWLKTGIEKDLIAYDRWKMVISGLGVTMIISSSAQFFGTVFGCFVCFLLMRGNKFVRQAANLYCAFIRGMPAVTLLILMYYIVFGSVNVSGLSVAVTAFTMLVGGDIAQSLKGAIESVDPVEIEAARSIGFSAFEAFTAITLPQVARKILPSYVGGFVTLVKTTAVVGCIAVQDLTMVGSIIRSRTFDGFFPIIVSALLYLTVTAVCFLLLKFAVKKIHAGDGR